MTMTMAKAVCTVTGTNHCGSVLAAKLKDGSRVWIEDGPAYLTGICAKRPGLRAC